GARHHPSPIVWLYIAAVGAKADVESANVVGYTQKAARADLNWYAPQFLSVGANTIDINAIRLNDNGAGEVGWGDVMQVVGPLGNASEVYLYWDPSADPNGEATTYYWGDENGEAVSVSFDAGDGIAIDNANALEFTIDNAGDVASSDVAFTAAADLNWLGNPFPTSININAISLDDNGAGNVGWGDVMQIVGPLGNPSEVYLYWDPSADPDGEATTYYWGDENGKAVDVTLASGAGFAIDNASALEFTVRIACPYAKK
ncbi:MAG: hypothetical protein ACI4RA_10590, partial [Kiritimatiellia bacterium]